MYKSPDYPRDIAAADFSQNFAVKPPTGPSEFYYGGMGGYMGGFQNPMYQSGYDPESRRNQAAWQGQTTWQQTPQYGYAQPQPQQQSVVEPIRPFSSYGGSGNSGLNGLMENRCCQTPSWQQPPQMPMYSPQFCPPQYAQYNYGGCGNVPVPEPNIPPIKGMSNMRPQDCWSNQYVEPRQTPVPNIDWNAQYQNGMPVQQFQYPYPQPNLFNGPGQFTSNWTDQWFQNKGVNFR